MPVVKSPRGGRAPYSPAKVSAAISAAYQLVYGRQLTRYRKHIQEHTQRVSAHLKATLGGGELTEWTREAILEAIHEELLQHGTPSVYETFLQQNPLPVPFDPADWDRLEPMPDPSELAERMDPVWTVLGVKAPLPTSENDEASVLDQLGQSVTRLNKPKPRRPRPSAVRRSAWLRFWQHLADDENQPMDASFLLARAQQITDQRSLSPEGWWEFWHRLLDAALRDDPRLIALFRALEHRRMVASLGGVSWLANTELSPEHTPLLDAKEGPRLQQQLWLTHLQHAARSSKLRRGLLQGFDLEALAQELVMERDRGIDWRGLMALQAAQALWRVDPKAVGTSGPLKTEAHELPQWAFMRLAMEAAHTEDDPMTWARRFYHALSQRRLVVLDALREAGKPTPTFLDDHTIRVGDSYRAILQATNTSALATQWTGTVTMDWRQVRAVGSPIAAGRRPSYGVTAFWEGIDRNLLAQGRQGEDRPVTVTLPLWHREALALLTLRETTTPRLQPTLTIPDLFFERLRERGTWYFFDPNIFPESLSGTETGYLQAEAALATRRKQHPYAVQQMAAEQVWKQLLMALQRGTPYLVFEGSLRAGEPFPAEAPSCVGLDGVGALPVQLRQEGLAANRWASGAVNLAEALDSEGLPDPARIQESIQLGMRLLDNLTMSAEGHRLAPYRSICLGPIGYYEAIDRASAHMNHDPDLVSEWVIRLAQVWHELTQKTNEDLAQERGAAPAWQQGQAQAIGPGAFRQRLRALRKGQLPGIALNAEAEAILAQGDRTASESPKPGRFVVCSVWAPFENAARLAGTTPGGIGTLYPVERVWLEDTSRVVPTPFLLYHLAQQPQRLSRYAEVLKSPEDSTSWPKVLRALSHPDREAWEQRLQHAALIRPWVEQGISVTLPLGMGSDLLQQLLMRAWWLGLNSIRFAPALSPVAAMDKDLDRR